MRQNAPNPFSTTTTITYKMNTAANATITLYDIFGREVAILADGMQSPGEHVLTIDAIQLALAPGMYFCTMQSGEQSQSVNVVVE
jgi:hypothetical protein